MCCDNAVYTPQVQWGGGCIIIMVYTLQVQWVRRVEIMLYSLYMHRVGTVGCDFSFLNHSRLIRYCVFRCLCAL